MLKPLLICLSALLLLPNLVDKDIQPTATYNGKEKFSPQLSFINTVDKLAKFVDDAAKEKHIQPGTLAYIRLLETTISYRFYDGCSYQTLQQDWISAFSDRIAGTGYSKQLSAEKILHYPQASSVQQNIVFHEILERKNLANRFSSINGQVAMEVYSNNNWHYADVAGETTAIKALSTQEIKTPTLHPSGGVSYTSSNQMGLLHHSNPKIGSLPLSLILSKIAWLFPLAMVPFVRRRTFKLYALKPVGKYVRMRSTPPAFNA